MTGRTIVWRPDNLPDTLPAGALDHHLSDRAWERVQKGIRPNTLDAYRRAWNRFETWAAGESRTALPATAETITEYVSHLCDQRRSLNTIRQAVAIIRAAHVGVGLEPPRMEGVKKVMTGYHAEMADEGRGEARQSPPVLIDALRKMVQACDLNTAKGLRDRLALVAGLALMGRRSELTALWIHDVRVTPEGLEVFIRRSKTDQTGQGERIAIPSGSHPLTSPVAVYQDWVRCLEDHGIVDGRLLRSVDRHGNIGESLAPSAINRIVKELALEAELPNAETYTAHSLRAGGATVAYAAGVPIATIAKQGRWNPKSPVMLQYIRAVDIWRDNAMRNVGL